MPFFPYLFSPFNPPICYSLFSCKFMSFFINVVNLVYKQFNYINNYIIYIPNYIKINILKCKL